MLRSFFIFLLIYTTNIQSAEVEAMMGWANIHRVGFVVEGRVETNIVKVGKRAKKNELLVQLDPHFFEFIVKQRLAKINQITPLVLDAKSDLNSAEDLFERTVLSEVELQKIKGKHATLVATKDEAQLLYQLAKWELKQTTLKSDTEAYVIDSNVFSGMIISQENKADIYIELASVDQAAAISWLTPVQKESLTLGENMQVKMANKTIPATVVSLAMKPNNENKYRLEVVFNYTKAVIPNRPLTLIIN